MKPYKPVIGLEVHIELSTASKMFCSCPADHFAKEPNTQVCPICLGLPGALPFANKEAVNDALRFGLSLNCKITKTSKFDRKHYFYPDLPKGYQISQYDQPLCEEGSWTAPDGKKVRIRRIHLEEDTAKLIHEGSSSLIDFNRSGVPLVELVTEPDFETSEEVVGFLQEIQTIARYLKISSADMEKGSMRLEANISMGREEAFPDYKVEIKNINSFKFLKSALEYEFERQSGILERGEKVLQETRGYSEKDKKTTPQRVKEEAKDYRYFPEPDLPPFAFNSSHLESLSKSLPELPRQKITKYVEKYFLPGNYAEILASDPQRVDFFEKAVKEGHKHALTPKQIAAVMVNQNWDKSLGSPQELVRKLLEVGKREFAASKEVSKAIESVVKEHKSAVKDYRGGKEAILGFLIGKVQKELKGKGDPTAVSEFLLKYLRENEK